MVGWYDPVQLGRTAIEVLISTIFGRHADKRITQALSDTGDLQEKCYYEVMGRSNTEFWFDYVSDVGDGFDATYTIAYHITRQNLSLAKRVANTGSGDQPKSYETETGELLILGGDEVYPTASFREYKERLTSLYEAVFPSKAKLQNKKNGNSVRPVVFAIPGNHDWYDSLVAFADLFCSGKFFAGWRTEQNRSYFAVKLPRGWWLFGTDMQLGSSLDKAQIAYFKRVMQSVAREDRIVLCNAEPHWITAKMYDGDPAYNNRNMGYFEGGVLKHQVAIYVAGDRHYYRRHEEIRNGKAEIEPKSRSKIQKFVAGGGGAFLHPTHNEHVEEIGKRHIYKLRESYPDEPTSRQLTYWNLLFPLWNWKFGILTGFLYLLTAQAFLVDLGRFNLSNLVGALGTLVGAALVQPVALFWVVLLFAGFLLFTDTHSKPYRFIAGPLHALAHLTALFLVGWGAVYFVGGDDTLRSRSLVQLLSVAGIVFASGVLIGPLITGVYLLISLNYFDVHHNEAFSAIKIPDYKNFLRFKIDADSGNLTIYPVGVEKVVKDWKAGDKKKGEPDLVPIAMEPDNSAFLIEEPIVFEKAFDVKPPTITPAVEAIVDADEEPRLITKHVI